MVIVKYPYAERRYNESTDLGVVEERVHAPREGPLSHVEVRVLWDRRELAAVLRLEVLFVLRVFLLNTLHPNGRKESCYYR